MMLLEARKKPPNQLAVTQLKTHYKTETVSRHTVDKLHNCCCCWLYWLLLLLQLLLLVQPLLVQPLFAPSTAACAVGASLIDPAVQSSAAVRAVLLGELLTAAQRAKCRAAAAVATHQ
jgi:hypothetical protein